MTHPSAACRQSLVLTLAIAASAVASAASPALRRQLALPASIQLQDAQACPALQRLAASFDTPLWIDRRIDPSARITLDASPGTLASTFDQATKQLGLAGSAVDSVIYLGPPRTAAVLPKLLRDWQTANDERLKLRGVTSWKRLATPRQIAVGIAAECGRKISNPQLIPHDLWDAYATPPMHAYDRLGLVLLGFDLTWRLASEDRNQIEIVAINYSDQPQKPQPLTSLAAKASSQRATQRFTLRVVNQPLRSVLQQLAPTLGLQLRIDPEAESLAAELVSFQVEQATSDQLLQTIQRRVKCSLRIEKNELVLATP